MKTNKTKIIVKKPVRVWRFVPLAVALHADPQLTKLAVGTWNVTLLVEKEPELVCEVER